MYFQDACCHICRCYCCPSSQSYSGVSADDLQAISQSRGEV